MILTIIRNWYDLAFRDLWAFYMRKSVQTFGTTTSNCLERYNDFVKDRISTDNHLTEAIEELMLFTEENYEDFTRRDCDSLKVTTQSWKIGSFRNLNDKLGEFAILQIVREQELSKKFDYKHETVTSKCFIVFRNVQDSTRYNVFGDEQDKYSCNCEYSMLCLVLCFVVMFSTYSVNLIYKSTTILVI